MYNITHQLEENTMLEINFVNKYNVVQWFHIESIPLDEFVIVFDGNQEVIAIKRENDKYPICGQLYLKNATHWTYRLQPPK